MPIRRTLFFLFLFSAQLVAAQQPLTLNNSTKRLKILLESKSAGDSVQLVIAVKNADLFQKENKTFINAAYFPAQTFVISLTKTEAARLLSDPNVLFADLQRVPKEELTTGSMDNTVNKINYMHHHFPQYKGDGIYASVKEQQFDSTDIDFRGRYFNSRVAAATGSSHASIMLPCWAVAATAPLAPLVPRRLYFSPVPHLLHCCPMLMLFTGSSAYRYRTTRMVPVSKTIMAPMPWLMIRAY